MSEPLFSKELSAISSGIQSQQALEAKAEIGEIVEAAKVAALAAAKAGYSSVNMPWDKTKSLGFKKALKESLWGEFGSWKVWVNTVRNDDGSSSCVVTLSW